MIIPVQNLSSVSQTKKTKKKHFFLTPYISKTAGLRNTLYFDTKIYENCRSHVNNQKLEASGEFPVRVNFRVHSQLLPFDFLLRASTVSSARKNFIFKSAL